MKIPQLVYFTNVWNQDPAARGLMRMVIQPSNMCYINHPKQLHHKTLCDAGQNVTPTAHFHTGDKQAGFEEELETSAATLGLIRTLRCLFINPVENISSVSLPVPAGPAQHRPQLHERVVTPASSLHRLLSFRQSVSICIFFFCTDHIYKIPAHFFFSI